MAFFPLLTNCEMPNQQSYAYLFIEIAMMLVVWAVAYATNSGRTLVTRRYIAISVLLYCLWLVLDLLAVARGVFDFPAQGNLPFRILGLPVEEHLFFPLHTAVIWMLVLLGIERRGTGDS